MFSKYLYSMYDNSLTDLCLQDAVHAYSGGLDKVLKMYDFNTSTGNYRLREIDLCFNVLHPVKWYWTSVAAVTELFSVQMYSIGF